VCPVKGKQREKRVLLWLPFGQAMESHYWKKESKEWYWFFTVMLTSQPVTLSSTLVTHSNTVVNAAKLDHHGHSCHCCDLTVTVSYF
jgi:hypothetical protein